MQVEEAQASLNFFDLIFKGGWVMVPLGILLVICITLIIERWMFLNKQSTVSREKQQRHIDAIRTGEWHVANQLCMEQRNSWGRIFIHAQHTGNIPEMEKLMEDAVNIEVAEQENRLSTLSLIAGVAPLLGFIGTIAGVITIFFDISTSQDISIGVISEGLYQKMISSASGLVVGILAFSAHNLYMHRIDSFVRKIQEHALLVKLARMESEKKG
jgi:biopolymer transport protein ExbB